MLVNDVRPETSSIATDGGKHAPALPFPVVGLGASAGGLAAFETFFSGMAEAGDSGMAYVLLQHLGPGHTSLLPALIQRWTRMPVLEAEDGMTVLANRVYVLPPGWEMTLLGGCLHLTLPTLVPGPCMLIDSFFRSMATDQGVRGAAVILSGTGSDGIIGAGEIKDRGGIVLVQSPETSEYDEMPRSALAAGLTARGMPPSEMPSLLAATFGDPGRELAVEQESAFMELLRLLQLRTGHDFRGYKRSGNFRAIHRQMSLCQIPSIQEYVTFLKQKPLEVDALLHQLLIGVTCFFRDPEAFQTLHEALLVRLRGTHPPGEKFRVWISGCSTGEEAYSIAILLVEVVEKLAVNLQLQIFATDLDSRSIARARAGIYPETIASHVSPARLARFFSVVPGKASYQINGDIRDLLVFSVQNLVKDPPFSRLDLIVCRNLLIYLDAALQKKLFPLFHHSMVASGILFLGSAETIGDHEELFETVDRNAKIYRRKEGDPSLRRHGFSRFGSFSAPVAGGPHAAEKPSLRELTEQTLLDHVFMAALLVTKEGNIRYQYGDAGMFLKSVPGKTGACNILKMARRGLRGPIAKALHESVNTRETVSRSGIRVKIDG
ncbi:MAG: chemotaxis-related methylase, partial [Verrucomicrobiota bacterium]